MDTPEEMTRKMMERLRLQYPEHVDRLRRAGVAISDSHLAKLESLLVKSGLAEIVCAYEGWNEAIQSGDPVEAEKCKADFIAAWEKFDASAGTGIR